MAHSYGWQVGAIWQVVVSQSPHFPPEGLSTGSLGFFMAWWLDHKGKIPKRTFFFPSLSSCIAHFQHARRLPICKREIVPYLLWKEYLSHLIRRASGMVEIVPFWENTLCHSLLFEHINSSLPHANTLIFFPKILKFHPIVTLAWSPRSCHQNQTQMQMRILECSFPGMVPWRLSPYTMTCELKNSYLAPPSNLHKLTMVWKA